MSLEVGHGQPQSDSARGRILAVDDTPANLAALGVLLERLGQPADLTVCVKDALKWAQHHSYDLILLDLRMPMMGGLETAQRLRRMGQSAPILLMTAFEFPEDQVKDLDALVPIDVIAGLVVPELLTAKVKSWLSLHLSARTWKTLSSELALENERLRGKVRNA